MDSAAHQEVGIVSKTDEQQAFIDKFRELLSPGGDPCVTLTNIYKEMPISYPASILEIRGHHVEMQTCELQLAAISQCNGAYIQSPMVCAPVLGRLDSIDIQRGTVRLSDFSYQELFISRRSTIRVRFKKPMNILAYSGVNKISGVIHDISLGGCCINTLVRQGLEVGDDIMVALKVIEQSSGQGLSMQIPSSVIRVTGDSAPFRCSLLFNHTPQSEQLLSIYINQRQLEILKELRDSL